MKYLITSRNYFTLLLLFFFISYSCSNSEENRLPVQENKQSNIRVFKDTVQTDIAIPDNLIHKKPLYVFSPVLVVLSDSLELNDTLVKYSFGDTLYYQSTRLNVEYTSPRTRVYENSNWFHISINDSLSGWVKSNDVALNLCYIKSKHLQVVLRASYGDGMTKWLTGRVYNDKNELVNDFGHLVFFINGFWIEQDKKFVFHTEDGVYLFDADTSSLKTIDSNLEKMIWLEDLNSIMYLTSSSKSKNQEDYIELGIIDNSNLNFTPLIKLSNKDFSLGISGGEGSTLYDLKKDQLNGIECYSFLITRFDEKSTDEARLYINLDGKLLQEKKE